MSSFEGKLRIENYSEWMTPAFSGAHVPDPNGEPLSSTVVEGRKG